MKLKYWKIIGLLCIIITSFQYCTKDDLHPITNNIVFLEKLSGYKLFKGNPADLAPADSVEPYTIATPLFSDYAEKQRFIKLPAGGAMSSNGNGLPSFPDGTILVKTFYYFLDKRDTSKGKKIIETRLLIKQQSKWNTGVFKWNENQTEAFLITDGATENVSWINDSGEAKAVKYHVPSNNECGTCHRSYDNLTPIGLKLRNMNVDVYRNGSVINLLNYFRQKGLLQPLDISSVDKFPDWENNSFTLEQRARAYMDINCAHCHSPGGFAAHTDISFGYEIPFNSTGIGDLKREIVRRLESGNSIDRMPKLGTTIQHTEGIALIKKYLNSF